VTARQARAAANGQPDKYLAARRRLDRYVRATACTTAPSLVLAHRFDLTLIDHPSKQAERCKHL
jgi:hypothetical protein